MSEPLEPSTLRWSTGQLVQAHTVLARAQTATERLPGAVDYKVTRLRREWDTAVHEAMDSVRTMVERYRRQIPDGKGGTVKLPAFQDGAQVPVDVWCTDPVAYAREDSELMRVQQVVQVPVRFTHEELAGLALPGGFTYHLFDCIDAPAAT